MFGFTIKILSKNSLQEESRQSFSVGNQHIEVSGIRDKKTQIYQDSNSILGFHGIIINEKKVLKSFVQSNLFELFLQGENKKIKRFLNLLDGEFSGFFLDRVKEKLYCFNNLTGTKKMLYTQGEDFAVVSPDLKTCCETIQNQLGHYSLDEFSCYQMLSFGHLIEDSTLIKEVKKVLGGEFLEIDLKFLRIKKKTYYDFKSTQISKSHDIKLHLKEYHQRFSQAVEQQVNYASDLEHKSIFLLSGGLDSRVNLIQSLEYQKKPTLAFSFSQSNYWDHKISESIAKSYGINYEFQPLDSANFLFDLGNMAKISNHSVLYYGSSHFNYAMKKARFKDLKLIHSGQIGDGILGNFNTENRSRPIDIRQKFLLNESAYYFIESEVDKIMKQYPSEELFYLQNIAFNQTVLGSYVAEQYGTMVSPFMESNTLKYSLEIPPEFKFNHKFYFLWLQKYVPKATKFIWESTLMKPDALWKKEFGVKWKKRLYVNWHKRLLRNGRYDMVPYDYYWKSQKRIHEFMDSFFTENISRLDSFPDLKNQAEQIYQTNRVKNKVIVLTLLHGIKTYFS